MYLIIDILSNTIIGATQQDAPAQQHHLHLPAPDDVDLAALSEYTWDGVEIKRNLAAVLDRAKAARKTRIKQEAARLIEALDWKLARAREREAAGWATLAELDAVLAEREAIRRSSSAAEVALDALTDIGSVQSFTWAVDVPVTPPRRLTHKQFTDCFTDDEMQAILGAAEVNGALKAWWEKFRLARDINLDDPATQGGVQALEIAGLIGKGRATEVLA